MCQNLLSYNNNAIAISFSIGNHKENYLHLVTYKKNYQIT